MNELTPALAAVLGSAGTLSIIGLAWLVFCRAGISAKIKGAEKLTWLKVVLSVVATLAIVDRIVQPETKFVS